ncbi:MAG: AAA family ATPase [Candidatus Harrisonbacteria bacterium]|nr:AAA family ATPase [Candidatus Harrisonbacteria bacterium]
MEKIWRVVITGGPCGGKTTAMSYLPEKLSDFGIANMCVPEAATFLITSGRLKPEEFINDRKRWLEFEAVIINTQILHENAFAKLLRAKEPKNSRKILLMDRGCMDTAAYVTKEEFRRILDKTQRSVVGLRDKRYDAVIHLATVADGKPELYTLENNPARYEKTPEEAMLADKRTREAWNGREKLIIIDNSTSFKDKMKRALKAVQKVIGIPVSLEIERKFLVKGFQIQDIPVCCQQIDITQTYLASEKEERIRRRGQDGHYLHYQATKTPSTTLVREEKERLISEERYQILFERRSRNHDIIRKIRFCFIWNNQYFELDFFLEPARLRGAMILEVELTEENDKVQIPDWLRITGEVTGDPKYKNYNLAMRP